MKRKTVGAQAVPLLQKDPETTSPLEQMREQLTEYDRNIEECISKHKNQWNSNFYVVVITKKEPLLTNVLRNYFCARVSCPTPDYDQTVYLYRYQSSDLVFLWTIPDRETCFVLKENAHLVVKEEQQLLQYVLHFADGTLFKYSQYLNGEIDTLIPSLDEIRK